MIILRIIFFAHFHAVDYTLTNCKKAFLLGFRYDLRTTSIITLPLLLFGSMRLNTKTNAKKLTAGSLILLILIIIVTTVATLILKNNKAGTVNISALILLLVTLLAGLFIMRDLNPFRNKKAKKIWLIYLVLFFALLSFFYALDFQHFDYLHQRLNASVLNYTQDAGISWKMAWQTYPIVKIILALVSSISLFYLLVNGSYKLFNKTFYTTLGSTTFSVILVIAMMISIFGTVTQYPLRWSDAFTLGDDFKANLALNPFQSFFSSLQFRHSDYNDKKVREAYPSMANYLGINPSDATNLNFTRTYNFPNSEAKKPNVIVVICESFSAYKSSMYGNPLNTTPYFKDLCDQGVFFDRCFTPAYGTARGVWAVITGLPDVENTNTASRNPAIVDQHSIINDMTGYEKYYFLGGSTSWANIRGLLTNNISGLHLYEEGSYKAKSIDVWGISDKHLFLEANDILKTQQKPFFAVIQTSDNHRPYTIPSEDKPEFKIVNYNSDTLKKYGFGSNDELNAFRYTDYCYSKFITAAKKENYFSNTIFVFVGDHGIRGDAGKMFPKSWTDFGVTTQHVPLLFYAPSILPAKRISNTCSQVDILPTVASLIQMPFYNKATGRNIFDTSINNNLSFPHNAFLFDPDVNQIGMMTDKYCYFKNLITGKENFASSIDNTSIPDDSTRIKLKTIAADWYETSKYLLSHNKKELKKLK